MVLIFITVYFLINVLIGFWAYKKVKGSNDFLLAGRTLGLPVSTAVIFATWFGSETIMGASSQFATGGLIGVIEDPFGAALCLILIGLFFARPLYRMQLLTFGDFYRVKFGRSTELIASFFLVVSYFGWIAAQMVALGIILSHLLGISLVMAISLGSIIVVIYTVTGGMWSVSITDFIQSIMIVIGLIVTIVNLMGWAEIKQMFSNAPDGFFSFIPKEHTSTSSLNYFAAWITIGLGSIPQQDVYQRVMSARSERVAVWASIIGGILYLTLAFVPLLIALYAKTYFPHYSKDDTQNIITNLVMQHCHPFVQIVFMGAILSAIMSTASGAILAPAGVLSENLLSGILKIKTDKQELKLMRYSVVIIGAISFIMALNGQNIFELAGEASALSLVSLFVPMCAGIWHKGRTVMAANSSIIAGMIAWWTAKELDTEINPLLYGLAASMLGYLVAIIIKRSKLPLNMHLFNTNKPPTD